MRATHSCRAARTHHACSPPPGARQPCRLRGSFATNHNLFRRSLCLAIVVDHNSRAAAAGSMECIPYCLVAAGWNGCDSPSRHLATEGSRRVEEQPSNFSRSFASRSIVPYRCPCLASTVVHSLRLHRPRPRPYHKAKYSVRHVLYCQVRHATAGGSTGCTPSSCGCAYGRWSPQSTPGTSRLMASGEAQRA